MNLLNVFQLASLVVSITACGSAPAIPTATITAQTLVGQPTDPTAPVAPPTLPTDPVVPPVTSNPVTGAPDPLPSPSPSPSPAPVTVLTFAYHDSTGTCNALDVWNPATTTILFPMGSGTNSSWLSFEASGVYIMNQDGSMKAPFGYGGNIEVVTREGLAGHPLPMCTITVNDGVFVSVI